MHFRDFFFFEIIIHLRLSIITASFFVFIFATHTYFRLFFLQIGSDDVKSYEMRKQFQLSFLNDFFIHGVGKNGTSQLIIFPPTRLYY